MHSFKRRLHHVVRITRGLKLWQLLVVLGLMLFVAATLLRLNNLGMVQLRDQVATVDKTADPAKISKALFDLQTYVNGHMNTSLDKGIYLQDSYNRAEEAALATAGNATTNPQSAIYEQAAAECKALFKGGVASYQHDYLPCVMAKISSIAPGVDTGTVVQLPKAEFYHYNFISPVWSPDFAGFSVLLTGVIILLVVARLGLNLVARLILRDYFRRIK